MITKTDKTAALIVVTLDQCGPMPFYLVDATCNPDRLAPGTLHDILNTMIAEGSIIIYPTSGFYCLPSLPKP